MRRRARWRGARQGVHSRPSSSRAAAREKARRRAAAATAAAAWVTNSRACGHSRVIAVVAAPQQKAASRRIKVRAAVRRRRRRRRLRRRAEVNADLAEDNRQRRVLGRHGGDRSTADVRALEVEPKQATRRGRPVATRATHRSRADLGRSSEVWARRRRLGHRHLLRLPRAGVTRGNHQVVFYFQSTACQSANGPTAAIVVHGPETLLLDCRAPPLWRVAVAQHESVRERRLYAVSRRRAAEGELDPLAFGQN